MLDLAGRNARREVGRGGTAVHLHFLPMLLFAVRSSKAHHEFRS